MASENGELSLDQDKTTSEALPVANSFSQWHSLVAAGLIILAALVAYHNSFSGPFIFDDKSSIPENPSIRQLSSIKEVLSPPAQGQAVQRRPIVNLSLAINYWLDGLEVTGYHVFNLSVHILAALLLFGVIRRTLRLPIIQKRFRGPPTALALAITLIWTVHPLLTEAVTYVIQRTELLAGLFYLLTLYCLIRGNSSARSAFWYVTAVISCLLGMGSKQVVVSAPFVVLLYDRVFLSRSFKDVFRRRWGLYVGLAATWGLLVVLMPHGHEDIALLERGWASLDYASTQFEVITNYLRLCFWPAPLILDYGDYKPSPFGQFFPYAIFIGLLLLGTILAFRTKPWLGFLGVWFFSILAPSSSFVPLLNQASAEKRMYLPLAAVVVLVVLGGYVVLARLTTRRAKLGRDLGYILIGLVVVILSLLSIRRNNDYASEFSIWDVTIRQRPNNPRAYNTRGLLYHELRADFDRAIDDYNKAIELDPTGDYAVYIYTNRGIAYAVKGNYDQAIRDYSKTIEFRPEYAQAYSNRGNAYSKKGDFYQAIRDLNKAIELDPKKAATYYNRGSVYLAKGDHRRAISDYNKAIELDPKLADAYDNRAVVYQIKGDYDRAISDYSNAIKLNPKNAKTYNNRGFTYLSKGELELAIRDFDMAIARHPTYAKAYYNLGLAYWSRGELDKAILYFEQALQLARASGDQKLANYIRKNLELYKAKRP